MLATGDNQTPTTIALQGGLLPHQLKSLRGKVVLVTGASSGLGFDLCLDLAKAGCRVVAAARRVDRLMSLCDEINGVPNDAELPGANGDQHQQSRAVAVELDVSANAKAVEAAVNRAWAAFGIIDALVNNAGIRDTNADRMIPFWTLVHNPFAGGLLQHQLKSLRGKVVLVTGASSGLGVDLCLDLAKAGCRVVAAARRVDRLISLCDEINGVPNDEELPGANGDQHQQCRAVAVELDVSAKAKAIEAAINRAWAAFGTIDALVNNAGIRGGVLMSTDLSEQEWDDVIRTNLKGTWLVSKFFCSLLHGANKSGSIINISSIAGLTRGQWPGATAYAASKAGIINLTQMMSLEMGNRNIRVNCISPGLFKSEVTSSLMEKDWINRVAMKSVPLRTFVACDPGLTSLVRYLIDDSSQYVSGNNFIVDGGHILSAVPIYSSL